MKPSTLIGLITGGFLAAVTATGGYIGAQIAQPDTTATDVEDYDLLGREDDGLGLLEIFDTAAVSDERIFSPNLTTAGTVRKVTSFYDGKSDFYPPERFNGDFDQSAPVPAP